MQKNLGSHVLQNPSSPSNGEKTRYACDWCFKYFSRPDILADHLEKANHTEHEPSCNHCNNHFRTFESLREHLQGHGTGAVAKKECSAAYQKRGCPLCLTFLEDAISRDIHLQGCKRFRASPLIPDPNFSPFGPLSSSGLWSDSEPTSPTWTDSSSSDASSEGMRRRPAVALDCEMVGGGEGGKRDLCARVCVVDENETVLLETFVMPPVPVTDYRTDITGITVSDLLGAPSLLEVRSDIKRILTTLPPPGDDKWERRGRGWTGYWDQKRLLVGHDLRHDLECLEMEYPHHLMRDTAWYPPLKRTNGLVHSLRYLTATYLGYEIQTGENGHHPQEDATASLRLYCRIRNLIHTPHQNKGGISPSPSSPSPFPSPSPPQSLTPQINLNPTFQSPTRLGRDLLNERGRRGRTEEGLGIRNSCAIPGDDYKKRGVEQYKQAGEGRWGRGEEKMPPGKCDDVAGVSQLEWRRNPAPFSGPERPKPRFKCWCHDK